MLCYFSFVYKKLPPPCLRVNSFILPSFDFVIEWKLENAYSIIIFYHFNKIKSNCFYVIIKLILSTNLKKMVI